MHDASGHRQMNGDDSEECRRHFQSRARSASEPCGHSPVHGSPAGKGRTALAALDWPSARRIAALCCYACCCSRGCRAVHPSPQQQDPLLERHRGCDEASGPPRLRRLKTPDHGIDYPSDRRRLLVGGVRSRAPAARWSEPGWQSS